MFPNAPVQGYPGKKSKHQTVNKKWHQHHIRIIWIKVKFLNIKYYFKNRSFQRYSCDLWLTSYYFISVKSSRFRSFCLLFFKKDHVLWCKLVESRFQNQSQYILFSLLKLMLMLLYIYQFTWFYHQFEDLWHLPARNTLHRTHRGSFCLWERRPRQKTGGNCSKQCW